MLRLVAGERSSLVGQFVVGERSRLVGQFAIGERSSLVGRFAVGESIPIFRVRKLITMAIIIQFV